jgi:hypothetical protein
MVKRIWLDVGCAHKSKGEKSIWFPKSTTFRNMLGGANAKQQFLIGLWGNTCLQTCNMQNMNNFFLVDKTTMINMVVLGDLV